ncbi:MAG: hypothetical protein JSR46_00915 [Verrucomicrobia bacterium]|nr:hypothetical protein [Verrucomicrobiota bacterium]
MSQYTAVGNAYDDDSFFDATSEIGESTYLGDAVNDDEPNPGFCSCFGRLWQRIMPAQYDMKTMAIRGFFAVTGLTSLVVCGLLAKMNFQQNENFANRSMGYGVGLGLSATVLTGSVLPSDPATIFADWLSRWSYEGLQILIQFYLNAGCPIDGNGLWNTTVVPPAVKELSEMLFGGVSSAIALLSLRTFLFPNRESSSTQVEDVTHDYEPSQIRQDPPPMPLFLESGLKDHKVLGLEQGLKIAAGITLITLEKTGWVAAPALFYLGTYLLGHVGGVLAGKAWTVLEDTVLNNCMQKNEKWLDPARKLGYLIRIASYGLFFSSTREISFAILGAIGGISKMVALKKFERLSVNNVKVAPFQLARCDNIPKGLLGGLFLAWYISGMTDIGLAWYDYANLIGYLTTALASYPLTRYLATHFHPRQHTTLYNSARFYGVDHDQVLILPFMLIRATQNIGDDAKNPLVLRIALDFIAWLSLGTAAGNNRALMGVRGETSPNDMSSLALLTAWFILGSMGRIR